MFFVLKFTKNPNLLLNQRHDFLTQSERIEPVCPGSSARHPFFTVILSQHTVRDAPPFEGSDLGHSTGEGK